MKNLEMGVLRSEKKQSRSFYSTKLRRLLQKVPLLRLGTDIPKIPKEQRGWFTARKDAGERFEAISHGDIVLCDQVYSGDHEQHWVMHVRCGHEFKISVLEILSEGAGAVCPFCNKTSDLQRFGMVETLQKHVLRLSNLNTYFLGMNSLGPANDLYSYYCLIHRIRFECTYLHFLDTAGHANGCPICLQVDPRIFLEREGSH